MLPDDNIKRNRDNMTPTELRVAMLRQGINVGKDMPTRQWQEQQLTFQSFL